MSVSPFRAEVAAVVVCALVSSVAQANVSIRYFDDFVPPDGLPGWEWAYAYYTDAAGAVPGYRPGVTRNGLYAYGSVGRPEGLVPFIWNLANDEVTYPVPGAGKILHALSDDGQVALLTDITAPTYTRSIWNAGTLTSLPDLYSSLELFSYAYGVSSGDGLRFATDGVVVWDYPTTYQVINGHPPYTNFLGWQPLSMSADGSRVLVRYPDEGSAASQEWIGGIWVNGQYWLTFPSHDFWPEVMTSDGSQVFGTTGRPVPGTSDYAIWLTRWTADQGMVDLLQFSQLEHVRELVSVSADGNLIGVNRDGYESPLIWNQTLGLMDLKTYLAGFGIDLGDGDFGDLHAISDDGRTFVVQVRQPDGDWGNTDRLAVITIPEPATALVLFSGLLAFTRRRR